MVLTEAFAFLGLLVTYYLLGWGGLPNMIGLESASFYARVVIVGFLGTLVLFPLTPLFNYLSRKDEREADPFATELTGRPEAMASALVKLSRRTFNHPHPLYANFIILTPGR
jgi:STE24 endopeptidase